MLNRLLIVLMLLLLPQIADAQNTAVDVTTFETLAPNAILLDANSSEVFYEKSADVAVPPASMSKLMTQAVVFDLLKSGELKDDQEFSISNDAWRRGGAPSGSSTMYAELNSKVRIIDLLRGAIIQSANDACIALAEGIDGSELAFIPRMEKKAKSLGLTNSTFGNVTGLPDPKQLMSVRDLATLAGHIISEHPERFKFYAENSFTWNKIEQQNRNPLLKDYAGADGMKTGFTREAGYGMVGTVKRDGRRLILVVAGLKSLSERKTEAERLLDWGFKQFKTIEVFEKDEIVSDARVWGGRENWVELRMSQALQVALTPAEQNLAEIKLSYTGPLMAPVKTGQEVGKAKIIVRGKTLAEASVLAASDVVAVDSMIAKSFDSLLMMLFGG